MFLVFKNHVIWNDTFLYLLQTVKQVFEQNSEKSILWNNWVSLVIYQIVFIEIILSGFRGNVKWLIPSDGAY